MDRAWKIVNEFDELVCCSLKHSIPCGVATGTSALDAYNRAYQCDPVSIFGGIVAINGEVDGDTAREMVKIFLEIVIASSFTDEALEVLKSKKNLRVILTDKKPSDAMELVNVDGGMLVQNCDSQFSKDFKVVTKVKPSDEDMKDLIFGQRVVKHVKSNAIVVVNNGMAKGISGGETNRIWPAEQALARAEKATVLCSDAFFPFDDVVRTASEAGIRAIIQPGGSMKDEDSVKAADELGIAMIFTGMRHFNH
jgi:phosphoribosylaminoimidazolecarboxamide formyltransferase/IMP cyclohydrolase